MKSTALAPLPAGQRRRCCANFFSGHQLPAAPGAFPRRGRHTALVATCSHHSQGLGAKLAALSTHDDEVKEQSRKFRRTVFDHTSWEHHRSTSRYNRHLIGILSSRMVRGLAQPLRTIAVISIMVVTYESLRQGGMLPDVLPGGIGWPVVELHSREPFTLTSFALSLLLVFRTNASYSRWLDARKTWGLLLNRSRDIVRQGLTWIPEEEAELRAMLCRWAPAFLKAVMVHLRKDGDLRAELEGILEPDEVDQVMAAVHRPNYVLQVLSQIVKEAHTTAPATLRMDENITVFEDCLGTCERILKTPIPLSYTRHTSRFLTLWLAVLPFMLYEGCGWTTVPISVLMGFLLLGIEEIGVSIEEPFSILSLEAICESSVTNVRELKAVHDRPADQSGSADQACGPRQLSASQMVQKKVAAGGRRPADYDGDGGDGDGDGGLEGDVRPTARVKVANGAWQRQQVGPERHLVADYTADIGIGSF